MWAGVKSPSCCSSPDVTHTSADVRKARAQKKLATRGRSARRAALLALLDAMQQCRDAPTLPAKRAALEQWA